MTNGEKWVKLLGYYIAGENDDGKALFHERMERCVEELGIPPLEFVHPVEAEILALYDLPVDAWPCLVLSGEAGVGKTRIIHKIHRKIGGDAKRLKGRGPCWIHEELQGTGPAFRAHFNRDLSASRKFGGNTCCTEEAEKIEFFSQLLLGEEPVPDVKNIFIMAANDGQLLKAWKDYSTRPKVDEALLVLEQLMGGKAASKAPIRMFHLSSVSAEEIFDLCLNVLVSHPGWQDLEKEHSTSNDIFSASSPLRRNYLALQDPIIIKRLKALVRLCDSNDWHLPVRNILAILANALLGVSDKRISSSGIMDVDQIRLLVAENRLDQSNFFANILGLNKDAGWRERTLGPFEFFRVGLETSNQCDDLILFGPDDEYKPDHDRIFGNDPIFPADATFEKFRANYLSVGPSGSEEDLTPFHLQLIAQRRRLFFRIPPEMEVLYDPWELTNFHYAKEYLEHILLPMQEGKLPHSKFVGPLVIALNRIWTGLLLDEHDLLFLTTALDFATGRTSEIEVKRIPTRALSGGEHPFVAFSAGERSTIPKISVFLKEGQDPVSLALTLTRYEFLRRVASGAFPTSFSRECSEDIGSFKSRLLARIPVTLGASLQLLNVNDDGTAGRTTLNLNN